MYAIRIGSDSVVREYRVYTLGEFAADPTLNTAPDSNGLYWIFADRTNFLTYQDQLDFIQDYIQFYYNASTRTVLKLSLSKSTNPSSKFSSFEYSNPGTYKTVIPPSATKCVVSVALGGGGGGGRSSEYENGWCFSSGGSGGYIENLSETLTGSATTLKVIVGSGGSMESDGTASSVYLDTTLIAQATGGTGWKSMNAASGGTPNGTAGLAGLTGTGQSLAGVAGANSLLGEGGAGGNPFATPFTPGFKDANGNWTYQQDPDDSCYGGNATGYGAGGGSAGWRIGNIPIGWTNNGQTCPVWCLGSDNKQEYQGYQWPGGNGSGGYVQVLFYFT